PALASYDPSGLGGRSGEGGSASGVGRGVRSSVPSKSAPGRGAGAIRAAPQGVASVEAAGCAVPAGAIRNGAVAGAPAARDAVRSIVPSNEGASGRDGAGACGRAKTGSATLPSVASGKGFRRGAPRAGSGAWVVVPFAPSNEGAGCGRAAGWCPSAI